jgi:pantoate--beta-alanine ligase
LTPEQRANAPALRRALLAIDEWLAAEPDMTAPALERKLADAIRAVPGAALDYAQALAYPSLEEIEGPVAKGGRFIAALAVKFGGTRLIDNRLF